VNIATPRKNTELPTPDAFIASRIGYKALRLRKAIARARAITMKGQARNEQNDQRWPGKLASVRGQRCGKFEFQIVVLSSAVTILWVKTAGHAGRDPDDLPANNRQCLAK
jgi:hypothetical protein